MPFPEAETTAENWEILPTLSLANTVFFPGMQGHVVLASLRAYGAVLEATRSGGEKTVAVFAMRTSVGESPGFANLFEIGTLARVRDFCRRPCCGRWVAAIEATRRVRLVEGLRDEPFRIARVVPLDDPQEDEALLGALVAEIRRSAVRIAGGNAQCPRVRNAMGCLSNAKSALEVPGIAMELLGKMTVPEQQCALELPLLSARLAFVLQQINYRLDRRDGRRDGHPWN